MIQIRNYTENDLQAIDSIWDKYYKSEFSLPDLSRTVTHAVAESNKRVIAFGMVKLFAEGIMVLDKSASLRDKTLANDSLLAKAFDDSRNIGLKQLHVAVADKDYEKLLISKYGFREPDRKILVKDL